MAVCVNRRHDTDKEELRVWREYSVILSRAIMFNKSDSEQFSIDMAMFDREGSG